MHSKWTPIGPAYSSGLRDLVTRMLSIDVSASCLSCSFEAGADDVTHVYIAAGKTAFYQGLAKLAGYEALEEGTRSTTGQG
jgi:hypothetical protein